MQKFCLQFFISSGWVQLCIILTVPLWYAYVRIYKLWPSSETPLAHHPKNYLFRWVDAHLSARSWRLKSTEDQRGAETTNEQMKNWRNEFADNTDVNIMTADMTLGPTATTATLCLMAPSAICSNAADTTAWLRPTAHKCSSGSEARPYCIKSNWLWGNYLIVSTDVTTYYTSKCDYTDAIICIHGFIIIALRNITFL